MKVSTFEDGAVFDEVVFKMRDGAEAENMRRDLVRLNERCNVMKSDRAF